MPKKRRSVLGAIGRSVKTAVAKEFSGVAAKQRARLTQRAKVDAITAGKAWGKKKPAPLTPAEIRSGAARRRRGGIMEGTALGGLADVLNQQKKKKP